MKRALLKTAFHVAVFALTLVLLIPTSVVLNEVVWVRLGARGDYHGGIGLLPAIVVLVLLLTPYIKSRRFFPFPGQRPLR